MGLVLLDKPMIHCFKTDDEPEGKVIVHRNFEGEHEYTENCWCRPEVIDADDSRDSDEIVALLETPDG